MLWYLYLTVVFSLYSIFLSIEILKLKLLAATVVNAIYLRNF